MRELAEEDQYEEDEVYHQRDHQQQKAPLVYPEVSENMFADLDEKAVTELAKGIFLKLPNYRSEAIRVLL